MNKIKFAVGVGLILSLLTACASADAEAEPVPSATAESLFEETGQITPEILLVILEDEDWSELGTFAIDEEHSKAGSRAAYSFEFTDPDMIEFIEMLPEEDSLRDEWRGLTAAFDELGITFGDLTGLVSTLYIVNPDDPEDAIYVSIDGRMIHDFMSE